ncbi:usherin [Tachysurus ichikawai]
MDRTVFEKRSTDRLVFLLTVSEMDVQFYYGVQTGQNFSITIKTAGHLQKGQWTHVALQRQAHESWSPRHVRHCK